MQSKIVSDQELVSAYLKGNETAFEILLKRHKDRIFTQIVLMVRDREVADDIFQETFMKAIRTLKQGKYNEEGKFLPWVLRIAHNLSIDHFRKAKKMPKVRSDENFDVFAGIANDEKNVEDVWIEDIIHGDIRQLIDELPEEQKEVVMMRHYNNMSFKEISDRCNVSINTSLGRMRYALINMRKLIEKNNITLTK
ncbi:sigma-70 family RNA polymerase sigma factor [Cryomorpha ignava]|uniref:Sigma-70 family RNA polymerase sigma factor n=1 Tax=Cryomorpha ignava TaxID=101383 RepID=A0A7K3WN13_9FLAO|nr:sigma-70 family RNA polymerase sigma factor [Cryomorpha ignava]NEN22391.1 sigma-70 family RNA polymerase sigma factor [Cryomorpha ignava]